MKVTITKKFGFLLLLFTMAGVLAMGSFYWFFSEEEQARQARGSARSLQGTARELYAYSNLVITGQEEGRKSLLEGVQLFDKSIQAMRLGGRVGERDILALSGDAREVLAEVERQ